MDYLKLQPTGSTRVQSLLATLPRLDIDQSEKFHPGNNLQEFHYFAKLPPEIRKMIWGFAAHEPRIIKIVPDEYFDRREGYQDWTDVVLVDRRVDGQTKHPGVLHTSREAREEGLRYYEPAEGTVLYACEDSEFGVVETCIDVFINFSVDQALFTSTDSHIYKGSSYHCLNFDDYDIVNFRYLALDNYSGSSFGKEDVRRLGILQEIGMLEEIVVRASYCQTKISVGQQEHLAGHLEIEDYNRRSVTSAEDLLAQMYPEAKPRVVVKHLIDNEIDLHPCSTLAE